MTKKKGIKILIVAVMFITAFWFAAPSKCKRILFNSDTTTMIAQPETDLQSTYNDDASLRDTKQPVYFSIFKFISGFFPSHP
jgi:hypothetical protein